MNGKKNNLEDTVEALKPVELIDNRIATQRDQNVFGLMTVDEIAAALGREPQTIRNWVARREIPYVPLGQTSMFLRDSVREWLQKKEFKPRGSY